MPAIFKPTTIQTGNDIYYTESITSPKYTLENSEVTFGDIRDIYTHINNTQNDYDTYYSGQFSNRTYSAATDATWITSQARQRVIRQAYEHAFGASTVTSISYTISDSRIVWAKTKPEDRMKQIIASRQAPAFIRSDRQGLRPSDKVTDQERRARETLRRFLGDRKFKLFLRNGFVTIKGKSGKVYQIFPGHGITAVYQNGKQIERLCVVMESNFPPTDSLIMRYLLILNDEEDFRSHAIEHSVIQRSDRVKSNNVDMRPLTEIFKSLKAA